MWKTLNIHYTTMFYRAATTHYYTIVHTIIIGLQKRDTICNKKN